MFKKIAKVTFSTLYTLLIVSVLAVALLFVGTKIDVLGYEVKVVQSGSMEPAIMTGGIVVIAPTSAYNVGDVITYGRDTRTQVPVTHRIVEKRGEGNRATFLTKGDANEDIDPAPIRARDIIGKVAFTIPYLGFVIEFARTPLGFALLIGIPALIIVLDEFANIMWEIHKYRHKLRRHKGVGYRTPSRQRQVRDQKRVAGRQPQQLKQTPAVPTLPQKTVIEARTQIISPLRTMKQDMSAHDFVLDLRSYKRA